MPAPTPWRDEYTLLCGRCGYVLEGIVAEGGACPECGKPVAESLPAARPGTAYQRDPRPATFVRTFIAMHESPGREFRLMRVDPRADRALLVRAAVLCGVVCGAAVPLTRWLRVAAGVGFHTEKAPIGPALMQALAGTVIAILGILLLTWIEGLGVVVFSRRRGWRVTHDSARAVCAHAACTWWLAGLGAALGVVGSTRLEAALWRWTAGTPFDLILPYLAPIAAFTLGMMAFETLVWMGVRECRFINRARPADASA
jgi:hypothetical protein